MAEEEDELELDEEEEPDEEDEALFRRFSFLWPIFISAVACFASIISPTFLFSCFVREVLCTYVRLPVHS